MGPIMRHYRTTGNKDPVHWSIVLELGKVVWENSHIPLKTNKGERSIYAN